MANDMLAILVRLSVVGLAGMLLVALLRAPVRRAAGAEAAYWLWLLIPASLVAVLLPSAPSCLCGPESLVSPLLVRGIGAPFDLIGAPLDLAPQVGLSHRGQTVTLIWVVGATAALAYFVYCQWALKRSLGRLERRSDGAYSSATAKQPMLVGAWHPRIVLPGDFETRYSQSERSAILAHERLHVERRDALMNCIALALVCLFWFNPVAYWAWSRFRFDQEVACDAVVLRKVKVPRRRYAHALAKTLLTARTSVSFGWRRRHPLIERIAILRRATPSPTRRFLGYALALVLMLSGTYVVWAAQPAAAPPSISSAVPAQKVQSSAPNVPSNSIRVYGQGMTVEYTVSGTRVSGSRLRLIINPDAHFQFRADTLLKPRADGSTQLEGNVRITAQVVYVLHSGTRVLSTQVRGLIANAQRAVLTPEKGGGFTVTLENGSVHF